MRWIFVWKVKHSTGRHVLVSVVACNTNIHNNKWNIAHKKETDTQPAKRKTSLNKPINIVHVQVETSPSVRLTAYIFIYPSTGRNYLLYMNTRTLLNVCWTGRTIYLLFHSHSRNCLFEHNRRLIIHLSICFNSLCECVCVYWTSDPRLLAWSTTNDD